MLAPTVPSGRSGTRISTKKNGYQYDRGYAVRWNGSSWQSLCNFGCFTSDFNAIYATGPNVWITGGDVLIQTEWPSHVSQPLGR